MRMVSLMVCCPTPDERQALHSIMKDLVALQMTRRQPAAPCDSSKPKSAAQANRQVQIPTSPGMTGRGEHRGCWVWGGGLLLRSSNILVPHASAAFLEVFLDLNI